MGVATKQDLYDYLIAKGVTRLCHFTKTRSFVHIISSSDGILATGYIKPDVKDQNDLDRFDGKLDYVCCSIEYPNSWYWKKVKSRDTNEIFREWIILCIDPEIVKHQNIKFCPCNAAYYHGRYIKGNVEAFPELFKTDLTVGIKNRHRPPKMLSCCPTDDQAEVLVFSNVPLRYITKIIVGSASVANNISAILKTCGKEIDIFIAPEVCDTNWSQAVRDGIRPKEEKFVVG